MHLRLLCCVVVQAEDGIRDLVRSRGLGDVYKRQVETELRLVVRVSEQPLPLVATDLQDACARAHPQPVSYTHLTLPTSDLV